jgi:S1-C subfamily serine protease
MFLTRHRVRRVLAALLAAAGTAAGAAPADSGIRPPRLQAGEANVIAIFKRVSPSVVSVANTAILRDLFRAEVYEVPQGAGSGIVWDKDGRIITNFHVVYGASALQVTLSDGSTYPAEIVGLDPDDDIAVIQIKPPKQPLVPIEVGRSSDLQVGQTTLAIGNPFGLDTSLSMGVVSALGRNIVAMSGRVIRDVIQTDAAINPGNSGGPLLDSEGRLIGMNTAIVSPSGVYAGVGFAVPVDTIRRAVPQLIASGRVRRPVLGVRMIPDAIFRKNRDDGVGILSVLPDSSAGKAGLKGARVGRRGEIFYGDILLQIDGKPVSSADDVSAIIDRHQLGDVLTLEIERDNKRLSLPVTLRSLE